MFRILIRRFFSMLLTMWIVSVAVFFISEILPLDVARNVLGQFASPETIAAYRENNGLNCAGTIRYGIWLAGDGWVKAARDVVGEKVLPQSCTPPNLVRRGFLRGDLGVSTRTNSAVAPLIGRRLANTAVLAGISFLLIMPIALILGFLAGLKEGKASDRIISLASLVTTSSPEFATAVFLIVIFSIWLKWLPGVSAFSVEKTALENPAKLVMPVLTLFFVETGYVARMTRASMVDVMHAPYVRTAILKGLPYRTVVVKHALRNALMAPITVIMLHVNWLIGGVVVVEAVFGFPGLGKLLLDSALTKDINVIEAGAMVLVGVAVATQLVADVLYTYLNPRIRYS
jgi:peptide/nickel transport system permease protein